MRCSGVRDVEAADGTEYFHDAHDPKRKRTMYRLPGCQAARLHEPIIKCSCRIGDIPSHIFGLVARFNAFLGGTRLWGTVRH